MTSLAESAEPVDATQFIFYFLVKRTQGHFFVQFSLAALTLFREGRKRCTARHSNRDMSLFFGAMYTTIRVVLLNLEML